LRRGAGAGKTTRLELTIDNDAAPDREVGFRPEIQGLRGVAVALVVVFHLWPTVLPGGYVGVDVFFVISGYLITGLLARAALREGRVLLFAFYSRRIRRLLPAAILVLMATLAGTLILLSAARWEETAIQVMASALYLQNWQLALKSVDYLGSEEAASPVQHYWSLSIEEQFYIVWPLLMAATLWSARRFRCSPARALVVVLGMVLAGSLAASARITAANPAWAYFVTHTRIWELALGGLLALVEGRFQAAWPARVAMSLAGISAVAVSALLFSATTPFPGIHALLPTMGAVLIIVAGNVSRGRFGGLDVGVLRYIGDRSYSIYLWHWPLITFYAARHPAIGPVAGLGLIATTVAISHLSYHYVEQRYRKPRALREWRPLAYGTAGVAVCVAISGGLAYALSRQGVDTSLVGTANYPGPAALVSNVPVPAGVEPLPPLRKLGRDVPVVYRMKCHQEQPGTAATACELGDPNGERTVVVTGDSHAAQWIPALDRIAKDRKWRLVTFTKAACPFSRVTLMDGSKPYQACIEWRENVLVEIRKLKPFLVVTSQSNYGSIPRDTMIQGLRSVWGELNQLGVGILAIRNTPYVLFDPGDCLGANPARCASPRKAGLQEDVFAKAAVSMDGVRTVDMNDMICTSDLCPAIVGNIIVWRDNHHMTATYALALAPFLAAKAGL